jgi:glucarate dehydratase
MRIRKISFHRVLIPIEAPIIWIGGVEAGWARTIVRILTDDGLEGLAETSGDDATFAQLKALSSLLIGQSPFDRQPILRTLWRTAEAHGTSGKHATAALETACWDLVGKAVGEPLYRLLGGKLRSTIPLIGYLHYRVAVDSGRARDRDPADVVDLAHALVERYGFKTLKKKGGVFEPDEELATMQALRQGFPQHKLRFDPNAFWSVETAIQIGQQLEELSLEWFEDPVWGIEGMSRASRDVRIPFATNMCCLRLDQLSVAIRAGAFDVELLDIDDWGGPTSFLKAAATCETFQIGVGLHSSGEAGIATAVYLHLAASLPSLPHAMDSHYHHQTMDVITEPHAYVDGEMVVPDGPGVGVEIDQAKLHHLERLFEAGVPVIADPSGGPRYPGSR